MLGGGGVGCFLNGKSSAALGTLPKKKASPNKGNNAGGVLLGHLWAPFQAAVTSYKSFYGDTLNRGPPTRTGTFTFLLEWDLCQGPGSKCTFQSFDLTALCI